MKSRILLFCMIFMLPFIMKAQWTSQTPPSGVSNGVYNDVFFIDDNTGWICGNDAATKGIVGKTTDAGATWTLCYEEIAEYFAFKRIHFSDANTGFVFGDAGSYSSLLKTTDGGTTWTAIITEADEKEIYDMFFIDESIFYLSYRYMDDDGIDWIYSIMKTENGGDNFTDEAQISLEKLFFANASTGWGIQIDDMTSETTLWKTTDGTVSFTLQSITLETDDYLNDIFFVNENTGWACGSLGTIYGTINGGETWTQQYTSGGGYGKAFASIYFTDENNGFAVGANGRIFKTTDGSLWASDHEGYSAYFSVHMISETVGWAVGEGIDKREDNPSSVFETFENDLIILYPTVSTGQINLKVNSIDLLDAHYQIIDMVGNIVKSGTVNNGVVEQNLSNGIYLFQIPDRQIASKFIIKK